MPEHEYVFTGKVLPERALIGISELGYNIEPSDDVPAGRLFVEVLKSQLAVRFVTSGDVRNVFTLRNIIEDACRMILDAVGFVHGYRYDIDIVQMIRTGSSEKQVFGINIPALEGVCAQAGVTLEKIVPALGKPDGFYLRHALSDVREAMKSPRDTGFFCYRAIESLKNCVATRNGIGPEKGKDWDCFRTTYSIPKQEIMDVKDFADHARHGARLQARDMSDADRAETFKRTWNILNKFILAE